MRTGSCSALPGSLLLLAVIAGCGVQEHKDTPQPSSAGSGGQPGSVLGSGGAVGMPGSGGSAVVAGGAPATPTGGGTGAGSGGTTGSGGAGPGAGGGAGNSGNSGSTGGRSGSGTGGGASTGGAPGSGGAPAAGGGSGITINIAGTIVPKEKAIAFIHFGHSNMLGHGSKPADLRPFFYDVQPRLWAYRGANMFVAAKEPTAPSSTRDTGAGPGMALLRTAAAAAPADYHFISIGRGQGSAPSSDYLKGHLLYPTVMDRAMELKGKVTFGAIFVMLGITERHLPAADQPGFPARMKMIIDAMRADLGEPNLPVLACDYELEATGTLSPTSAVGVATIPMLKMLPTLITRLALVPTNGLGMQDDHHFDFAGQKLWSERAIMLGISNGWFAHWLR